MDLLGALVIAAGALFGIWLGAYYAAARLGAQLNEQARWFAERRDEDRRRLLEQLQAESERLDRQLDHDRRMRDRDELRRTLDEAIEAMGVALNSVFEVLVEVGVYHVINKAIHKHVVAGREFADPGKASVAAVYGMGEKYRRLRFRLWKHELTKKYSAVRDSAIALLANPTLEKRNPIQEDYDQVKQEFEQLKVAADQFIQMAADFMSDVAGNHAQAPTRRPG